MDILRSNSPHFNQPPLTEKICPKCGGDPQPIANFYVKDDWKLHQTNGYSAWCKEHFRAYTRSKYNPASERVKHIEKTYGITADEYDTMLQLQMGVCAICGNPPNGKRPLVVDHEHETGIVRELLCDRCNSMLGRAKDSVEVLERAIAYLKKHTT